MNHYERLKVTHDAPPEVIRAAYRALANRLHPDRTAPGGSGDTHEQMAALNAAYEVLIDPALRRDYDDSLSTVRTWAAPADDAAMSDRDPAAGIVPSDLVAPVTAWAPELKHIVMACVGALVLLTVGIVWVLRAETSGDSIDSAVGRQVALPDEVRRNAAVGALDGTGVVSSNGGNARRPSVEELSRMSDEELLAALPALDGNAGARPEPRVSSRPHPLDGPALSLKTDQVLLGSYVAPPTGARP